MLPPKLLLTLGFGLTAAALAVRGDQQDQLDQKVATKSKHFRHHGSGTHFAPSTVTSTLTPQQFAPDSSSTGLSSSSDVDSKRYARASPSVPHDGPDGTARGKRDINPQNPDHKYKSTHVPADEIDPTPQHPPRHDSPQDPDSSQLQWEGPADPNIASTMNGDSSHGELETGNANKHDDTDPPGYDELDCVLGCSEENEPSDDDPFDCVLGCSMEHVPRDDTKPSALRKTGHAKAYAESQQEDCDPLDPLCPSTGPTKRDQKHISGTAGTLLLQRAGKMCQWTQGDPWLDCMNDYKDGIMDYFEAQQDEDQDDIEDVPMKYHADGAKFYQWAKDDCTLTEASDSWDECMDQFKDEVDDQIEDLIDLYTDDDDGLGIDKRDEPTGGANVERTNPEAADRAFQNWKSYSEKHCEEYNRLYQDTEPSLPCQNLTPAFNAQWDERITDCKSSDGDAWPQCVAHKFKMLKFNMILLLKCSDCVDLCLNAETEDELDRCYKAFIGLPDSAFNQTTVQPSARRASAKRDTPTTPFEEAKASIIEYCQTHTHPYCETDPEKLSAKLDEANHEMEAGCKSTAGDAWQECLNRFWKWADQDIRDAAGSVLSLHASTDRLNAVVKRTDIPVFIQSDMKEYCDLHPLVQCSLLQDQLVASIEDLINQHCTTTVCGQKAWQMVHEAYQDCKSDSDADFWECAIQHGKDFARFLAGQRGLTKRHGSTDSPNAVFKRDIPDDLQAAVDEGCKVISSEQCDNARDNLAALDTAITQACDSDDCADDAWDIVRKSAEKCKAIDDTDAANECMAPGMEDLKEFLDKQAGVGKRSIPDSIQDSIEKACQQISSEQCDDVREYFAQLDTLITQACITDDCANQAWDFVSESVDKCEEDPPAQECLATIRRALKQFLVDHPDDRRRSVPVDIQDHVDERCADVSDELCKEERELLAQTETDITEACDSDDCTKQAWDILRKTIHKCEDSPIGSAQHHECTTEGFEDLRQFLADQAHVRKRSIPESIQKDLDEWCDLHPGVRCQELRRHYAQFDVDIPSSCKNNGDCEAKAWSILHEANRKCIHVPLASLKACTAFFLEELERYLESQADLAKRYPPPEIATELEQYCYSHQGHQCDALDARIRVLDFGIDQYCKSPDHVVYNECATREWSALKRFVQGDAGNGKRDDSSHWLDLLVKRDADDAKQDVKNMLESACAQGLINPVCDDLDGTMDDAGEKAEAYCKSAGQDGSQECVDDLWEAAKQATEDLFNQAGITPPQKRSEWTHRACSRGVQWACEGPKVDEQDWQPPVEVDWKAVEDIFNKVFAHVECGLGNDDACEAVQSNDQYEHSHYGPPVIAKRDDDIPTELRERITHTHTDQGQVFTAVLQLVQTKPTMFHDTFYASGTKYEVIISQMKNEPTSVAQTIIYGDKTNVRWTRTDNTASIGKLTSLDFGAYAMAKRTAPTPASTPQSRQKRVAEPPHTADPSVHHHLEKDAFSSWLVDHGYISPGSLQGDHGDESERCYVDDDMPFSPGCHEESDDVVALTPARRDANHVETMTIVDQRPGHTTLNPEVAMQTKFPTTSVTVVHIDGTKHTLFPTTNSNGNPILGTEGYVMERAKETVTATVVHWPDSVKIYRPDRTETNVETTTVHFNSDMTVPLTETTVWTHKPQIHVPTTWSQHTIDAPIPKIHMRPTATVYRTVTKVKPAPSGPIIIPSDWDVTYTANWENIMEMPLDELKLRHPYADWATIARRAEVLRSEDPVMNEETSMKIAFIMMNGDVRHKGMMPPLHDDEHPTQWVAVRPKTTITRSGSTIPITASSQMIAGTPYVVDPLHKYSAYHAYTNNVAPTGSCHERAHWWRDEDGKSNWPKEIHEHNETECRIEQCMWDFMRPINITTVTKGFLMASTMEFNYFTYWTELRHPHWGTLYDEKVYYPMTRTKTMINNTISIVPHRATPDFMNEDMAAKQNIQMRGPMCHDIESCHAVCAHHHPGLNWFERNWKWGLPVAIAILLLPVILCCCIPTIKRRRNQRKQRKMSEKQQQNDTVVNRVNGQPTDPAGNPVSPETAAAAGTVAGAAAGAEAARQDQAANEDGRGTMGRRAEEGRGRVNFEDGGHPGSSGETHEEHPAGEQQQRVVTTQGGEQHAEPQPVPDKDGAGDGHGTGRQGPDVGSMRGRKRNRLEGLAGLGLDLQGR